MDCIRRCSDKASFAGAQIHRNNPQLQHEQQQQHEQQHKQQQQQQQWQQQ